MIKKIIKKVLWILLLVLVGFGIFLGYQFVQYKNREVDDLKREVQAESEVKLQEELFNKEMEKAENLVETINNDIAITVLRTSGKITLSHDKTPANNAWTEWLFNSDIKVYADYNTAFTIETSKIQASISDDATVTITFDPRDIELSFIDITDFTTSENKSVFGSSYNPEQVAAFERIARESIQEKTDSDTNRLQAKINLESYFGTLANDLNVNIKVNEK